VEKVINICYDPNRKPMIALTAYDDKARWQIATENMKVCV
jgi:ribosomal protein L2